MVNKQPDHTVYEARLEFPDHATFIAYRGSNLQSVAITAPMLEWGAKQIPGGKAVIIDPSGYRVIHKMATWELDKRDAFKGTSWAEIQNSLDEAYADLRKRFDFRRR